MIYDKAYYVTVQFMVDAPTMDEAETCLKEELKQFRDMSDVIEAYTITALESDDSIESDGLED